MWREGQRQRRRRRQRQRTSNKPSKPSLSQQIAARSPSRRTQGPAAVVVALQALPTAAPPLVKPVQRVWLGALHSEWCVGVMWSGWLRAERFVCCPSQPGSPSIGRKSSSLCPSRYNTHLLAEAAQRAPWLHVKVLRPVMAHAYAVALHVQETADRVVGTTE